MYTICIAFYVVYVHVVCAIRAYDDYDVPSSIYNIYIVYSIAFRSYRNVCVSLATLLVPSR